MALLRKLSRRENSRAMPFTSPSLRSNELIVITFHRSIQPKGRPQFRPLSVGGTSQCSGAETSSSVTKVLPDLLGALP